MATSGKRLFSGKKRWLILMAPLLCIGALIYWVRSQPVEPTFEGRSLSSWLEHYDVANRSEDEVEEQKARAALTAMGTNAIPFLLKMLCEHDSELRKAIFRLLANQKLVHLHTERDYERSRYAAYGFRLLGCLAEPAVPELIKLYEKPVSVRSQMLAASALGDLGSVSAPAVPALIRGLSNSVATVRYFTVRALWLIHPPPEMLMPVLIPYLNDPHAAVRHITVSTLAAYGSDATAAIPPLRALSTDQDQSVRQAAAKALSAITSTNDHSKALPQD